MERVCVERGADAHSFVRCSFRNSNQCLVFPSLHLAVLDLIATPLSLFLYTQKKPAEVEPVAFYESSGFLTPSVFLGVRVILALYCVSTTLWAISVDKFNPKFFTVWYVSHSPQACVLIRSLTQPTSIGLTELTRSSAQEFLSFNLLFCSGDVSVYRNPSAITVKFYRYPSIYPSSIHPSIYLFLPIGSHPTIYLSICPFHPSICLFQW